MHSRALRQLVDVSKVKPSYDADWGLLPGEFDDRLRFVSQIQLRTFTNAYCSRSESGQANAGVIGSALRGQISSNSRTRSVRLGVQEMLQGLDAWEVRGRDIGRRILEHTDAIAPDAPLAVKLKLALIGAFISVSKKKAEETGRALSRTDSRTFDQVIALAESAHAKTSTGEALTEEEQSVVSDPAACLYQEDTIQPISVLELEGIAHLARKGYLIRGSGKREKLIRLEDATYAQLIEEVSRIYKGDPVYGPSAGLGVAAFGSTKTDLPDASVRGGISINDAFSVGKLERKASLFTAVADEPDYSGHAGAEHLGIKEVSSGVFCEPALYDVTQLRLNLHYLSDEEFEAVMHGYYRAMAICTPHGGQRAHVTRSAPEFIVNVISRVQPLSYQAAFLKPIQGGTEAGDMVESAQQLIQYLVGLEAMYGADDYKVVLLATPMVMEHLDQIPKTWTICSNLEEMISTTNSLTGLA